MARYSYSGRDRSGGSATGEVDAPSRRDALRILASRGVQVSRVSEAGGGEAPAKASRGKSAGAAKPAKDAAPGGGEGGKKKNFQLSLGKKDSTPRKAEGLPFLEALYELTSSGLSAGEAVRLLSIRIKDPRLRALTGGLWEQLSEGVPLSRAMGNFPQVFDTSTVNLIQAGEATGSLNDTLTRIIAHQTERKEMQRQLLTALAYPSFMVFVAVGVVLFFLFFLLPRLQTLLQSLGGEMPTSTALLVGGANFLLHYGIFVILALILGGVTFWRWRHTEAGRIATDGWMLRLPLVGPFVSTRTVYEFSQNLAVLLANGITASEALRMTERQITNRVHRAAFIEATARVLEGEALSASLARTQTFPDLVLDRLAVGENTGNVVPSLQDIAKGQNKVMSQKLSMFTGVIATGVLCCVFVFVGFIAFAIVSAIFQVSASFK